MPRHSHIVEAETPTVLLPDQLGAPMINRLAAAVSRLGGDATDASSVTYTYTLREMQQNVFENVAEFLRANITEGEDVSPYGRIIQPPRTGKTVIAGSVIAQTGLTTTFIVNTKTQVEQAEATFRQQLPETLIGVLYSDREEVVPYGVNITTYDMMRSRWAAGTLPEAIRTSALVFADEAHHSMTKYRLEYLREAFDPRAIRIALTATPDYNIHRALAIYFPELIHELTILEAVEMQMLAPVRVWVAEVDADASTVNIVNGEYHEETLSRLMSEAPFFKAAEAFRYSEQNRREPTLITCQTRQQAYDCLRYLQAHRPAGTPSPALVLGETVDRDKILERFQKGVIDTIVSVKVLVEGWDSPECKVLIDLAPCLSLVMATQKFCRVLTRNEDREARIFLILPANLTRSPIMPMELLAPAMEEYEAGTLVTSKPQRESKKARLVHPRVHPVEGVQLKSRIVLVHRVEKPRLNRENSSQVRTVLASNARFVPDKPCTYRRFRSLIFRHELFTGRADHLMRYLGFRPMREQYEQLLERFCPEGIANLLLADDETQNDRTCEDDRRFLLQASLAGSPASDAERDKFEQAYYALGARDPDDERSPETIVYVRELWKEVVRLLEELTPIKHRVILWRIIEEMTLKEVGDRYGLSGNRIRDIQDEALGELRRHLYRRVASVLTWTEWDLFRLGAL